MERSLPEIIGSELESRSEIAVAYVFGSVARGSAAEESDIDVAVSLAESPRDSLRYRAQLAEHLTRAAGRVAEVVILEEAPPALAGRIVRQGRVVLCRDEAHRVRAEVSALQREFDTEPLRRLFDRAQSESIRAGRAHG